MWHLRDAWNRDAAGKFAPILDQAPPSVVHTHLIDGFSAAVWRRARAAGIPVIHTAHDYHLLCPRAFLLDRNWNLCENPGLGCRIYRKWHLRTAADIDLFVSPSRFLLDRHRQVGFRPRRAAVVRNGIPMPSDASRIRLARNAGDRRRFLLMCRLTVEKGVRLALSAAAKLNPDLDFELTIAGRGPLEAEVRAAAANDPRIRFAGYVTGDGKAGLLTAADYLLIPSLWYENAPLAVIEAAAYGLGLLGSRIGGIPELVREGRTGVLFEPGDASGLAERMEGLITRRIALDDLATASWDLASKHTVDRMIDAYLNQYDSLTGAAALAGAA